MKRKRFLLVSASTAILFGVVQTLQAATDNQEPIAKYQEENSQLTQPRDLHVSMSHYFGDSKYNSFWSWYTDWLIKVKSCKSSFNKFSAPVLKRQACQDSKKQSFPREVEDAWYDIIDTALDFTWGLVSNFNRKGYGLWKQSTNYCKAGQYQDNKLRCKLCPIGCTTCNAPDQCITCQKNFTYVEGYNFGYCYPDCQKGSYVQHLFTDDRSFTQKMKMSKRIASMTPSMMASQCEKCPTFCGDCIFDEETSRAFCYQCQKGFTFNNKTGSCELTACDQGQYRIKQLVSGQKLTEKDNIDDYICRDCIDGCRNCTNNQTCQQCKPYFTMKNQTATQKICLPCPAFCQTCVPGSNGLGVCQACEPKFYPINNGLQCVLNRTCVAGQWFNDATLECQSCPSNCLTCKQGPRNGTSICLSCTSDMNLNLRTNTCVDKCNRFRQFFSSTNGSCIACSNQTYPDQTQQKCQPCTKNCLDCGFSVNTNISRSGFEVCSTCVNTTYYESKNRVCRPVCSRDAVFNYTILDCVKCNSDQYKNFTTEQCITCPKNCSACEVVSNKVQCTSCKSSSMVVDFSEKNCRPNCTNADHYFDFKAWQCKACPSGKIINQTNKQCDACPKYCSACYSNSTSKNIECSRCSSGYLLDKTMRLCRPACLSWMSYYFETGTCRECPPYQTYSYVTKKCESCAFGCINCYSQYTKKTSSCITCDSSTQFDYKTFQCKLPCNSTTLFNYNSNTCENCPNGRYLSPTFKDCRACSQSNCATCNLVSGTSSQITQCTACNTGYFLEATTDGKGVCKKQCGENTLYNAQTKTCAACPNGQYVDSISGSCISCPQNCSLCKTTNGILSCTQCRTSFLLESSTGKCRESCSSSSPFYDSSLGRCTSCPASTYYNQSLNSCTACPTHCQTCGVNFGTNKLECYSCNNDWEIDTSAQQCRPSCPSNYQYDTVLEKCTLCPAGTWYNSALKKCQNCPQSSCKSCQYVASNNGAVCTDCFDGFVFDSTRKQCRAQCSNTQIWSWENNACMNCPTGQYLSPFNNACTVCPVYCTSCSHNFDNGQVECNTCRSGSIIDQNFKKCKLACSSSQYYDWNSNTCQSCNVGSLLYPGQNQCQTCPTGCSQCSYNSQKQQVECQACESPLILDSKQPICRVQCNQTAYFDYERLNCINCQSNQFLDSVSGTCKVCPSNCQSCFVNSSSQIECTTCSQNFLLERQTCRKICNTTSYYDWNSDSCLQCKIGEWLQQDTKQCQKCDIGCYQCSPDILNPTSSQCDQCLPTLVLDQGVCRKQCSSNQFYDWSISDCRNCTYPCLSCADSTKCTVCDEMFSLNANGQCTSKCISGSEIWNSATKKCDSIRKLNLTVSSLTSRVWRCRNTTLTTIGSGFQDNESPVYSWQYDIISGGVNKDKWTQEIDFIINSANSNKLTQITLPSTLTEKISDNTTIRFSVTMILGNSIATNFTNLIVEPFVFTQISNYSKSYQIWVQDGLPLQPAFMYPECPVFKGPQAIPATISIGCSLYDSRSNLIKALPLCQVQPNELSPGLTYFIKYFYAPNPQQTGAATGLRDTITVTTIAQLPACSIQNSSLIYVKSADTITLSVSVINGRSTFVYQWNCNPLTQSAQCGILQTSSNNADLSIPASSFTAGGQYNFTLSITENNALQTRCSARVEVVAKTQTALTITFLDNANSRSYLDPAVTQNIMCYQSQETIVPLSYSWSVTRISDRRVIFVSSSQSSDFSIQSSGNSLSIAKNILGQNTYDIQCSAQNTKYTGTLLKTYTTSLLLPFNIKFDIFPSTGRAQDTVFSLSASKPAGQDLWCKFGYINGDSEIAIFDSQTPVYPSSSQTLMTKLDRVVNRDIQTLFVNCYDSTGAYARSVKNVTVTAPSIVLTKNLNNLSKLIQSKGMFLQTSTPSSTQRPYEMIDIFQSSEKVKSLNALHQNLTGEELKNSTVLIDQYLKLMMNQINSISDTLASSEINICIELIDDIIKITQADDSKETLQAINSLMANQKLTTLEKDQFERILGLYSLYLNSSTLCVDQKLAVQKNIQQGLLRVSGNILMNSSPYTVSNNFVSVYLQKLQKLEDSINVEVNTLWKNRRVSVTIPNNEVYGSKPNLIIIQSIFNNDIFGTYNVESDIVKIELYSALHPISYNGKVEADLIAVQDLENPIIITFDLLHNEKAICSYFDENIQLWKQLSCKSSAQLDTLVEASSITCCTPHLTSFAAIYPAYYSDAATRKARQFKLSLIPSLVLVLLLVLPLVFRKFSKEKELNVEEPQPKQLNNTTSNDMSTKSPNHDEVSEFEISPAKMNPSVKKSEEVTTVVGNIEVHGEKCSDYLMMSKLYIICSRSWKDFSYTIKQKFLSTLVLFLCFSLSLPLIQANSLLAILPVYIITALFELILSAVTRFSNMNCLVHYCWMIILAVATFVQPVILSVFSSNLGSYTFDKWLKCSLGVIVLTVFVQDLILIPLGRLAFSRIISMISNQLKQ